MGRLRYVPTSRGYTQAVLVFSWTSGLLYVRIGIGGRKRVRPHLPDTHWAQALALPLNTIIEATIEGLCLQSKILNVFHYVVTTSSTTPNLSDEMAHFLDRWTATGVGSFRTDFLELMPDNYTWQYAHAQPVAPDRYVKYRIAINANGIGDPTEVTNMNASLTLQTDFGGRKFVGGKRIMQNPANAVAGSWSPTTLTKLQTFCEDILAPVTATSGGGVYTPCLWHRNEDPSTYNILRRGFPQTTARTMRRRTLGLGI